MSKEEGSESIYLRPNVAEGRKRVLDRVMSLAYDRREQPFKLASGKMSHDYVDAKLAIASGPDLASAAEALIVLAGEAGVEFDAVGGLTMGADALCHAVALLSGTNWFSVRKQPKDHGTQSLIEGFRIGPGDRVFVVDDVVTTGGSIQKAIDAVRESGATPVFATCLVDRGTLAEQTFAGQDVLYRPLLSFTDLGIEPI